MAATSPSTTRWRRGWCLTHKTPLRNEAKQPYTGLSVDVAYE